MLQQLVFANPKDVQSHLSLGGAYIAAKNYPAAQSQFEEVLQLDPANTLAFLNLGKIAQDTGQTDAAIQKYEKALLLQPKFVPLMAMLGNLYLEKNDLGKARQYYENALAVDPNFAIAASNLAWISTKDGGNLDVALTLAQKAKQAMPEVPAVSDTLGWVQYKKGNYSLSVPLFEQCVDSMPGNALYHYHLGLALVATGESAKAKQELQAALKLNLKGDDLQQAQKTLAQMN
jgi:tetratricopeptide (TPR) repeat protein